MIGITNSQQVVLSFKALDSKGQPAKVDGVPQWKLDKPEVLKLTPAADGLTCTATALGPLGVGRVSVTGDADLGTGVTPLAGTIDIEVYAGKATLVSIDYGTPTEQAATSGLQTDALDTPGKPGRQADTSDTPGKRLGQDY